MFFFIKWLRVRLLYFVFTGFSGLINSEIKQKIKIFTTLENLTSLLPAATCKLGGDGNFVSMDFRNVDSYT